eukprot:418841_1
MVDLNLGETEAGENLQTVESAEDGVDKKSKENDSSRIHMELENLSDLTEGFRTNVMETIAAAMDNMLSCTIKNNTDIKEGVADVQRAFREGELRWMATEEENQRQRSELERVMLVYEHCISRLTEKQALQNTCRHWKTQIDTRRAHREQIAATREHARKAKQARAFEGWRSTTSSTAYQRATAEAEVRLKQISEEIILKYEVKLGEMQRNLDAAIASQRYEKERVIEMEKNLRKVLLRGMTSMNMEALSLFDRPKNQTHPATEPSKEIMEKNPNAVVTILPPAHEKC